MGNNEMQGYKNNFNAHTNFGVSPISAQFAV